MTPDVNVLVAAARADHPHHGSARRWLDTVLASAVPGSPLRLMPMVVASFLRLVTSPRIFVQPSTAAEAVDFVHALLEAPNVTLGAHGDEWPVLRQLCLDRRLQGNDLPDAWLAAATLQAGDHLVTFDRDFRRLLPRQRLTVLDRSTG